MKNLSTAQILILSASAGLSVANVYYSQPILASIASSLNISKESAGSLTVLSQVGYGIGLFFLTPLGDMTDRRRLILCLQCGLIASLLFMAFAPGVWTLYIASLFVGATAVVAQVILPMAASLAAGNKGKVVGQVFTGLLTGILLARMFSGFIDQWYSWRAVYLISSVMVAFSALLIQLKLPGGKAHYQGSYTGLLKSTLAQLGRFPALRSASLTGMLAFAILCAFWVSLTLFLGGSPFHFSSSAIGLFGVLAVAGALLAPLFGRLSDGGSSGKALLLAALAILAGVLILLLFPSSLLAISVATVLLDVGVQAAQVTNIAIIYSLDPSSTSRINTVYMTCYFIGGGAGSYLAIESFRLGGWVMVLVFMLVLSIACMINVLFMMKQRTAGKAEPFEA